MQLSVIIPAFNEATKILTDLKAATQYLKSKERCELLIVNDGSSDQTSKVVRDFIAHYNEPNPSVRLIDLPENRGKGAAVRAGILEARGYYIAFADAGLCVPFQDLDLGIAALDGGADFAIGSRRHAKSQIQRSQPTHRKIGSRVFGGVVRSLMGVRFVSDTQCGFKIYTARAARAIFDRVQTEGFMFDVEALLLGHALGLKVEEFPVQWSNDSDTRYDPVAGTIRNFKELCAIRWRAWKLKKECRSWQLEYS